MLSFPAFQKLGWLCQFIKLQTHRISVTHLCLDGLPRDWNLHSKKTATLVTVHDNVTKTLVKTAVSLAKFPFHAFIVLYYFRWCPTCGAPWETHWHAKPFTRPRERFRGYGELFGHKNRRECKVIFILQGGCQSWNFWKSWRNLLRSDEKIVKGKVMKNDEHLLNLLSTSLANDKFSAGRSFASSLVRFNSFWESTRKSSTDSNGHPVMDTTSQRTCGNSVSYGAVQVKLVMISTKLNSLQVGCGYYYHHWKAKFTAWNWKIAEEVEMGSIPGGARSLW